MKLESEKKQIFEVFYEHLVLQIEIEQFKTFLLMFYPQFLDWKTEWPRYSFQKDKTQFSFI
jgi:hypothetical protein